MSGGQEQIGCGKALSVRSALHLNSQPISRVVTLGVAGVQVPNVLFGIHYSVFTLFNYSGKVMQTVKCKAPTSNYMSNKLV